MLLTGFEQSQVGVGLRARRLRLQKSPPRCFRFCALACLLQGDRCLAFINRCHFHLSRGTGDAHRHDNQQGDKQSGWSQALHACPHPHSQLPKRWPANRGYMHQHIGRGELLPAVSAIENGSMSEAQLRPKLQDAWVVRGGHVPKVLIGCARIDTKEFGVVESVEGLESQFKLHPFCDGNGFE